VASGFSRKDPVARRPNVLHRCDAAEVRRRGITFGSQKDGDNRFPGQSRVTGRDHLKNQFARVAAQATGVSIALDERDRPTHEHCHRVAGLSIELGAACGLSDHEMQLLQIVAGFHDVGKIGIPDRVLKKLTRFNDDDWNIMKEHAAKGERIIRAAELDGGDTIATAVRHHHERYDGQGYPDGLKGERIPILARIVAIADTYDAMARMRFYIAGRTHSEIMQTLRQQGGKQHDPEIVERFAEIIERSRFKVG
jgi:HD-GYP domain-containing protein (c-di-GMP phosphodiesterase class II)